MSPAVPPPSSFFLTCSSEAPEERKLAEQLESGLTQAGHSVCVDAAARWGERSTGQLDARIARSELVVALLSEASCRNEHVLEVLRRARRHHEAQGRPRLLAVRVGYGGALPYELPDFLPEWRRWDSESDSAALLQAVLEVARGSAVPPGAPSPATARPPEPAPELYAELPDAALPASDRLYVERAPDSEARKMAAQGLAKTLVLKAPPQFGKSSLLLRYRDTCRAANKQVALVNLGLVPEQELKDYPTFLSRFAAEVARQLDLPVSLAPRLSQMELRDLFEDKLLSAVRGPLVIALDRVDRVLGYAYQTDFCAMLRAWHDSRAFREPWRQLGLVLVISTAPTLLISDPHLSPFNVGTPIKLDAFSEDECRSLNLRHPHPLSDEQVHALWQLLGGHPYLTRLAYAALASSRRLEVEDTSREALDDGPFGEHLRALSRKLQQDPERHLREAMQQVIQHHTVPDDDTYYRLEGAGLCRRERSGRVVPANQLYARYFGERA